VKAVLAAAVGRSSLRCGRQPSPTVVGMAKWQRQKQVARGPKRRSWNLNNMSVRVVKVQRGKSGHDSMTPLVTRGSNSNTTTMNDEGERPGRVRGETPKAGI
jgi:hypothetical protein